MCEVSFDENESLLPDFKKIACFIAQSKMTHAQFAKYCIFISRLLSCAFHPIIQTALFNLTSYLLT